ncbi:MAG: crossover junction endodeoxyribonuclease RuvC [Chitinophagaceae bacterium]|nr:crossover junction endodeoxyribonuclease RuvC [Chitinophagaceae bacterium]
MGEKEDNCILGVDLGTHTMGYAIINTQNKRVSLSQFGVIRLEMYGSVGEKLFKAHEHITEVIKNYKPDTIALESPFLGKNVNTLMSLARCQGVIMLSAFSHHTPLYEYSPRSIKLAVAGNGNATKEQVAKMLQAILSFEHIPKLLDATDALAVAVCHHFQNNGTSQNKTTKWKNFVENNQERIIP